MDPKKGIVITYAGGDKCTNGDNPALNGQPRQTKFKLECSDRQEDVSINLNHLVRCRSSRKYTRYY
jgi:hypothetical protein